MKYRLSILTLIIALSSVFGQTKESALRDAKITAQATLKEDFKTVLEYTHPNVIEASGGLTVILPQIEEMYAKMKSEGLKFIKADVLEVSEIIQEQGAYRCFVKNLNVVQISGKTIKSTSYLLGSFLPNATHWFFVEAEKMKNPQTKEMFFPDFQTTLDIPNDSVEIIE